MLRKQDKTKKGSRNKTLQIIESEITDNLLIVDTSIYRNNPPISLSD